jgi:hypothetical protein
LVAAQRRTVIGSPEAWKAAPSNSRSRSAASSSGVCALPAVVHTSKMTRPVTALAQSPSRATA